MNVVIHDFLREALKQGKKVNLNMVTGQTFRGLMVTDLGDDAVEAMHTTANAKAYVIAIDKIVWAVLA